MNRGSVRKVDWVKCGYSASPFVWSARRPDNPFGVCFATWREAVDYVFTRSSV